MGTLDDNTGAEQQKKRRIPGLVYNLVLELADLPYRYNASQIRDELERRQSPHLPDIRTIRDIIQNDLTCGDVWEFEETEVDLTDPESGRLVLEVLSFLAEDTFDFDSAGHPFVGESANDLRFYAHGFRIRKDHAEWIVRLRRAYPGMPEKVAWAFARKYTDRVNRGVATADIDLELAGEGWWPGTPQFISRRRKKGSVDE